MLVSEKLQLTPLAAGLNRPECVLATKSGLLATSDWNGGIHIISPNGPQHLIRAESPPVQLKANGIALLSDGSFLLAQLGDTDGGLYRLFADGRCETFLTQVDGINIPPSNYPHVDFAGRIWLTVSTKTMPRASAYRADVCDGFIILVDGNGARVVADDLGYVNECCVHPDGQRLFVNETFQRRLVSYDISDNGDLTNRKTIFEFGCGTFPDGLTFDQEGQIWVTSIVSNRVIRLSESGESTVILEDSDPDHLTWAEQAYQEGRMGRPHLDKAASEKLKNISSLAFGGPDMKTAYLGCLLGDKLWSFQSPVPGWKPSHWNHPISLP